MRMTEAQARMLLELNRGNLIVTSKDRAGRRYTRWNNTRGRGRSGKPGVATWRAFKKRDWIEPEDEGVGTWRISGQGLLQVEDAKDVLDVAETRAPKLKVTANDVLEGLQTYYNQMGFVLVPEVSIAYQGERRADALVLGRGNEVAE